MAEEDASGTTGREDDVRRKFREALERKRGQESGKAAEGENREGSRIHGAHGPEASRRNFRRKSG